MNIKTVVAWLKIWGAHHAGEYWQNGFKNKSIIKDLMGHTPEEESRLVLEIVERMEQKVAALNDEHRAVINAVYCHKLDARRGAIRLGIPRRTFEYRQTQAERSMVEF